MATADPAAVLPAATIALQILVQPDAASAAALAEQHGLLHPAGTVTPIAPESALARRRRKPLLASIRLRSLHGVLSPTAQLDFRTGSTQARSRWSIEDIARAVCEAVQSRNMSMEDGESSPELSDEERLVLARDQTRRQLIVVSVVLLVVLVGGTALAALVISDPRRPAPTSFWVLLGIPLAIALAGLGVAMWVFWHRSIRVGGGWLMPAAEPSRSRRVLMELSRGGDIADEDREFARVHASRQARAGWIPWVGLIAGVLLLIGAVTDRAGSLRLLGFVFGLMLVLSALWQRRMRGRLLANASRQGLLSGAER